MTTGIHAFTVEFGDCGSAGIAWYSHFYGWFDAVSHRLAERAGSGLHALRAQGHLGLPHPEDSQRLRAADIPVDFRRRFGFA
jgi:acyl-CoA thioesterase FadM